MRLYRFLPAISLLAALLFANPVNAASTQAAISIVDVAHFNPTTFTFPGSHAYDFRPGSATVSQGGTVTWTDNGYDQHTVTSYTNKITVSFEGVTVQVPTPDGQFDSGFPPIQSGQSWTLDTAAAKLSPGDYHYFCQIHPWMQALLHVVSGTSHPSASVNIDHHQGSTTQFFSGSASWGFLPRDLQVKKGTQVAVTNNGILPHTFSSYTIAIPVTEGYKTLIIPISDGVFNETVIPGQSWTLDTSTLNTGTYTFACLFHPWMKGSLTVS